jgi:signal transduction histidine kinase
MSDELLIEEDLGEAGHEFLERWKIIIVDDDPSVHQVTRFALQDQLVFDRPLELLSAYSAHEGFLLVRNEPDAAMAFIDVVMESEHAGLDLIRRIREELNNHSIRLVLRTGQPGITSEVEVTSEYDINQYTEKTQLTSARLISAVYTAIRAYRDIVTLNQRSEELVEALEAAQSAEKVKTEFLSRMSHELKTPMNVILGYTQLLQLSDLQPKQKQNLAKVVEAGHSLLKMLNDILCFSSLDLGTLSVKPAPVSLDAVMETFTRQFSELSRNSNIGLQVYRGQLTPDRIFADQERIEQILQYLGENAFKFTQAGGVVTLNIEVEKGDTRRGLIVFSITDTGIGMSAEQQKMLFRLFTQVDGSITRNYGGVGVGLIIAQKLAALMGGEIGVDSSLGEGSCFQLKLPIDSES